jgi:hypothetical protein
VQVARFARARTFVHGQVSRIRGAASVWQATEHHTFTLPLVVDFMSVDESGSLEYLFEATIDLINGQPGLAEMSLRSSRGLDTVTLQREFRWASPVAVITRLVPRILTRGLDPFIQELPVSGFPKVLNEGAKVNARLSDDFLEQVACDYLAIGRGYATAMSIKHGVLPRTVVSWVEKARQRGSSPPCLWVASAGGL